MSYCTFLSVLQLEIKKKLSRDVWLKFLNLDFFTNKTVEWTKFALFYMSFWPVLDRKLAAGVTPVTTFFRVFLGGKAIGYRQGRTQGGCTGCTCIPPPPLCIPPPLPSLKGWLWEKMRQWATRKKCKFVYLRLDNFLTQQNQDLRSSRECMQNGCFGTKSTGTCLYILYKTHMQFQWLVNLAKIKRLSFTDSQ